MLLDPGEQMQSANVLASLTGRRTARWSVASGDLRLLAVLADQTEDDVVLDVGAGVAEQTLVDVADLLDVDVAERDPAALAS